MRGRIRTIKPEAFLDEELWDLEVETGLPIFRGFVGLWTQADREGRFEWRPRALKTAILPYWDGDFSRVLDACVTRGFLVRYASGGREYGVVKAFTRHQLINNREIESELPEPPDTSMLPDTSTRAPRVDDACPTRHVPARVEGKGREHIDARVADAPLSLVPVEPKSDPVAEVFDHWRATMGHPAAKLDGKRRKRIQAALKLGYSKADLVAAIDGCRSSEWHMGANERDTRYDGLGVVLRDADQIDKFLALQRPAVTSKGVSLSRPSEPTDDAIQEALERLERQRAERGVS